LGISGRGIYLNLSFEQRRRDQIVASKVGSPSSERDEESLIFRSYQRFHDLKIVEGSICGEF